MTTNLFYSIRLTLKYLFSSLSSCALAFFIFAPAGNLFAQGTATNGNTGKLQAGQMPYFDAVPDPIEGFNRCSWEVNNWLFRGVIYPVSFGYNFVVPQPVRTRISNVGHNMSFPVRFFNSCFQGKWHGAWEETKRFGADSTVGLGGFFDPATTWKIGRSDEDFGQTLGHCGSGPWFYLVLPLLGPCNGRDAVGKMVDWPMDICSDLSLAYWDKLWPEVIRPSIEFNLNPA